MGELQQPGEPAAGARCLGEVAIGAGVGATGALFLALCFCAAAGMGSGGGLGRRVSYARGIAKRGGSESAATWVA